MKTFKQFLSESNVYRGVTGRYDAKYSKGQDIVWVTTSEDHAEMYTSGDGQVVEFDLNDSRINPLNLGFRSVETETKFDEVKSRFKVSVMELFGKKRLNRSTAMEIVNKLDDLELRGHKQVWQWVHEKEFLELIRMAGFNAIIQNEGLSRHKGDVVTYGILDQSLIRMK